MRLLVGHCLRRVAPPFALAVALVLSTGCIDEDATLIFDAGADAAVDGASDGGSDGAASDAGDASTPAKKRLAPSAITKFKDPLVIPPAMPYESKTAALTEYAIAVKQIEQQVLPSGMPKTTVWGYGRAGDDKTFNYPAFTVEARADEKVRVKWINGLVDADGNYLPHLLPVDQTLHWANPPGPVDTKGTDATPYTGPVPIVTHLHGAHVPTVSDGFPEAWFLPDAKNIPSGYATKGTHYDSVASTDTGAALFEYANDQHASTLWYHDHALGITRLNVYAGLAGFYLLRDAVEDALNLPGPAPQVGDAAGTRYYEIPLAIQDRSFYDDGSLFYPASREDFDGYKGPFRPETKVHPIWNPEFFGDVMVVNGRTWPFHEVEKRLYRLRLLNGCNARFLILKLDKAGLKFHQIGGEGGLLPGAPVAQDELLMSPGERADVIVDFSSLEVGDEVVLLNVGPDEPFKGASANQTPADPNSTGVLMKFKIVAATADGNAGVIPTTLPSVAPLTTTVAPRDVTLNELVDPDADIPTEAELGTNDKGPLSWSAQVTEAVKLGDTEIWRVINLTEDAHPIHLHLVMFQILDRRPIDAEAYKTAQQTFLAQGGTAPDVDDFYSGPAVESHAWEKGWTDTVIVNPGEVARIIATFDIAGLYVWHCHILEHEDNEMMRPFTVAQ